jgi:hypothetical protein
MAKNKTTTTTASVTDFVRKVPNEVKMQDSLAIIEMMKSLTGFEPQMWGPTIIGFGSYHYRYASGHEGDAPLVGFSPRKDAIVFYLATEFKDKEKLLLKLGKHTEGKGCVYVKKLADVDLDILKQMIIHSVTFMKTMDTR